jgi:adenylate cyclase
VAGAEPDESQRRTAINLVRTQSLILVATWAISGAVLIVANPRAGLGPALLLVIAVSFGCTSSVSISLLFPNASCGPSSRPPAPSSLRVTAPGVVARLVIPSSYSRRFP